MHKLWAPLDGLLTVAHDDEIVVRRGRAVLLSTYGLLAICLAAIPVLYFSKSTPWGYVNIAVALVVYSGVMYATRRGHVLPAAIVFNVMNALGPVLSMLALPGPGTSFYLVFILLLAAATLPPSAVVLAGAGIAPLLVARYTLFAANTAVQQEVLSATLILLLAGVVAFVLSLTSESSIRRLKRALAEHSDLNATLEERVQSRTADLAAAEQRRRDTMKGVAHDMGNMLMMMSGSAALAADALEQRDVEAAQRLLERFESTTLRLGRVAADLMDSALAETGQLTLHPETLDLEAATGAVLEELAGALARGGLTARVEGDAVPPALADPDRIKRVMHNIIGNAIKFTPTGGRITISILVDGEHAVWTCRDTGCGIDPERLHLLGQELLRFDPGTSQGMGLGLYTSTLIVRASGGEIAYASAGAGTGTAVSVSLPLAAVSLCADGELSAATPSS